MKPSPLCSTQRGLGYTMRLFVLCALASVAFAAAELGVMSSLRGNNAWLRYTRSPHPLPVKQALRRMAAQTSGGMRASPSQAAEVQALVHLLESAEGSESRPTWQARGSLIAGRWDQIYTDNLKAGTVWASGTSSRRKLVGPISGRILQCIEHKPPNGFTYIQRARSSLAFGLQAEMRASVRAEDDGVTWQVSFDSFHWSLLGGWIPLRKPRLLPRESGGEWRTTYVDSDTRIIRALNRRGGPAVTYVLGRCT